MENIKKKVTFSIIGCGNIAQRHAGQIKRLGKLISVCDIKKDRADKMANEYNVEAYYNINDLLSAEKQADVISICTPHGLHAEYSIKSLKSGHHVLCEKPMALKTSDCRQMIAEAKKAKKKLFIVKQNRFNPPVVAVKEAIDRGLLGKILSVQSNVFWNRGPRYYNDSDWYGTKEMEGGALFTQVSHFIDLLYWLVGDIKESRAFVGNYNHQYTEIDDQGVVIVKFKNNALGTIHYTLNSCNQNMEGSVTILGKKGTVKIGGEYLNTLEYQSFNNGYKISNLSKSMPANNYGFYKGTMANHGRVYENLIEVLNGKKKVFVGGTDGIKTVEIINKIYKQAKYL